MGSLRAERGTTLVEAIVAIGILAGAAIVLAGLSSLATRSAAAARDRSISTALAYQKMEDLCRDVSAAPLSPANAWALDTPGFVEHLDVHGKPAGGQGRAYVRRWAVTPLVSDANLLAIQVAVAPCRKLSAATQCGDVMTQVRLASVRSRTVW